ncbi:MAG: alpha-(1-_3)-arabinofuranosyltransferase family protein [Candidatus Desulfofervidaceae bacterium]|nr:alpha-(1->3)-arabinofuranosyltransferase family protein [Candidatus Desulfofervidaceae bacterium]
MGYYKLKKIIKIYPELLLIMIVGLLSITWFRGNFLVNPGDTNFSFNPPHDLYRSLFVWDHHQGFGRVDSMATAKIFPYNLLLSLLSLLGISIYESQKILFYLIFTSSGLTAYFLIKYLLASKAYNRIAALLGANFYMMNTYLIQLRWGSGYLMGLFFYAVFPFLVLMWFKGRTTKNIRFSIYMVLGCLFALPSLNNPAYIIPFLVICGLDFLLQLFINFRNKVELVSFFKYVFTTSLIFVSILSFWIVSIQITLKESLINLMRSTLQFKQEIVTASESSILNLFRNLGDWVFWGNYKGELYYPYSPIYNSPLFIIIGFAIIFFLLSALFFLKRQNIEEKYCIVFFSLLFLIGIWFSKGVHSPLGEIYKWALINIPLFKSLRAAYEKFGPVLCISIAVLIAFSLAIILQVTKARKGRVILVLLLFSLINIYAWPFWTGDIWRNQGKILPGLRFQIPEYYSDIKQYLDNSEQQSYRILQLPDNATLVPGIVTLNLNGRLYAGSDPLSRMLEVPIIYLNPFNFSISENMTSLLFQHYSTNLGNFVKEIQNLSKILNIKLVLLRNDSDNTLYSNIRDSNKIKPFLRRSFMLENSFGKLDLYHVSNSYFLPHIYPSIPNANTCDNSNTVVQPLPTLTFHKISPTRYEVKVENATAPFFLVFSESYHPKWKAYIKTENRNWKVENRKQKTGNGKWEIVAEYPKVRVKEARHEMEFTPKDISYLFKKPLPEKYHLLVNGYANAWYIDPKKIGQRNFTITLYFWPQSLFYLGLFISGVTLLGCLGYLGWDWRRRRGDKKLRS